MKPTGWEADAMPTNGLRAIAGEEQTEEIREYDYYDNPKLVTPFHLPTRMWLSHIRAAKGYETAVRVLGSTLFLILAFIAGVRIIPLLKAPTIGDFGSAGWPALLSSLCLFLFYIMLFWLILHRSLPMARTDSLLPSLTAFLGTYFPWTIGVFAPEANSVGQGIVSASLLLISAVSMIVVIVHLGHCFSIVPQARRLVRTGPYRVVRHPLYLAEEVALLGMLLQYISPLTLALFLVHGALQVRRIFYEDSLLRRTFPDFDDYARSTSRLIPYVW